MRALITGATGFVGTHLTAWLLSQGDEVLGVSRSAQWPLTLWPELQRPFSQASETQDRSAQGHSRTSRKNDSDIQQLQSVELLPWNIMHPAPEETQRRIHEFCPDVIFHLAAVSNPADCGAVEPTEVALHTNVGGTGRVIELATQLATQPALMLASSCHVYGSPTGSDDEVDEEAAIRPENGYGRTKWQAEELLSTAVERAGLNAWVVRGFQQTGPRQSERMLLPEWTRQFALQEPSIHIRTLGTTLDLMDVRDTVRIYAALARRALQNSSLAGQALNVGTGIRRSGAEIIEHLQSVAGYQPSILESSPGVRRNPIARIDRLQATIDIAPGHAFRDTVRDTYDYWRHRLHESSE